MLRARATAPFLLIALTAAADAAAKPGDPADRGLDLFIDAPSSVRAGDLASLDLLAYGFVTVTDPRPLAGATILATWDPETLGAGIIAAPGDVTGQTDASGHATIKVPMPDGDGRKITLLVALHHGEHVRTRKVDITRRARSKVDLRLADTAVVPGSTIPAWVTVSDARTGQPVKGANVDVALREGDLARETEHVVTDASGLARTALVVPPKATGQPRLTVRARLLVANHGFVDDIVDLGLREERPATPTVTARWKEPQLKPAEIAHATIDIHDAAGEPIANHPLRYWTGPRGTTPPATEEEWEKAGKATITDGLGHVDLTAQAPRVVTQLGSSLSLVVHTELESQKVDAHDDVQVGLPVATADLDLEGGELVPGAKQHAYLHVTDGEKGVAGAFTVKGDGLDATVTTDDSGDVELTWPVPEDVGARRETGPCAGGVAAAVTIRQVTPIPALSRHPEPFETCVTVGRERAALLRPSVYVARVGDRPTVKIEGGKRAARGAGSITLTASDGTGVTSWSANGEATVGLDDATPGLHTVTMVVPRANAPAEVSQTELLVVPKVLPKITAKVATTKLAPGADVDVDVALDDGHGRPLVGTVSAVVIDKEGGGSLYGFERLDTRLALCQEGSAPKEKCDAFLEGDPKAETLRRASIATGRPAPYAPQADPAANAKGQLSSTFSDVLHSLEGAVFQAQTPESLRDVRRKENGRWVFNPELITLVTAAMSQEPTTPGGDPFKLNDLIAVDPQVTFDAVARRVTRLKLFNVLSAIRSFVQEERLTPDEPVLKDPNALVRRMVRDHKLEQDQLLDPWGGTMEFVHAAAAPVPFLTVIRGWDLHAPGPDGKAGTGDDVKDPFERVVRSGSPYAVAMGEDEIVDARLDMRVGDATVGNWKDMFDRLTGQVLGRGEGTGTGEGFGSGHGRLGGSHQTKAPQLRMGRATVVDTTRWTDPVRTDASGHARIRVHLGDDETTWQIGVLGRTDAGQSATAIAEASTYLPFSAHVDIGRRLIQGDAVGARVIVRNRTPARKAALLQVGAEGGLVLAPNQPPTVPIDVPPNAVRSVFVRYIAQREGLGHATVAMDGDRTSDEVAIDPPGEPLVIQQAIEVARRGRLKIPVPTGWSLRDNARVVVESGLEGALLDALASFDPEPSSPADVLADAIEVAARIEKIGEARNDPALVAKTHAYSEVARAYLPSADGSPRVRASLAHASLYPPPPDPKERRPRAVEPTALCPKKGDEDAVPVWMLLETEPPPGPDGPPACFTTLTSSAASKAPLDLARTALALADRPHRATLAQNLTRDLAKATNNGASFDGTRAEKAIVLAALVRSGPVWAKDDATNKKLAQEMLTLRDVRGGYGSAEATRDVVRALVALEGVQEPARVTIRDGKSAKIVDVAARGRAELALGPSTQAIDVEVTGGPVVVRLERPVLRRYEAPPDTTITPITVAVDWPTAARVDTTGVVHVSYTSQTARDVRVHTALPLPPGVELAAAVQGAALRQGVVHLDVTVKGTETVALPVRFTLPGAALVPEADTRTTSEEQPRSLAPARWLTVQ